MELLDLIRSIQTVSMESSINVCDAIVDVIDKNELIKEYDDESIFDDIIMESMMIFMESKNRERDKTPRNEIAQWMEKKGYWYTGDNPKKKKECNRMYHFLQQHKFDPKTETYESDIKLKDGSNKRIKLVIDPKTNDLSKDGGFFKDTATSVRSGDNAVHKASKGTTYIGSKTLRGKQSDSQFTLKHEEGHAASFEKHGSSKRNYDIAGDRPDVRAAIDEYKSSEHVNSHDDSVEEILADTYSIEKSRKRTKDWGKTKGTRKFNQAEIEKMFTMMSKSSLHLIGFIDRVIASAKKTIKILEKYKTMQKLSTDKDMVTFLIMYKGRLFRNYSNDKNIFGNIRFDDYERYLSERREALAKILENEQKYLTERKEMIKGYKDEFKSIGDDDAHRKQLIEIIKDELSWLKEDYDKILSDLRKLVDDINGDISRTRDKLTPQMLILADFLNDDSQTGVKQKKMTPEVREEINKLFQSAKSTKDFDEAIDRLDEDIVRYTLAKKDIKKRSDSIIDSSTKMRLILSQKFVKEYFEYLMEDYGFYMD